MSDFATAPIHTFIRLDSQPNGAIALARFYPYDQYPIFFSADTEAGAAAKANAWRKEQLAHVAKVRESKLAAVAKAQQARRKSK